MEETLCLCRERAAVHRVPLKEMKADWHAYLNSKVGFKGAQSRVLPDMFRATYEAITHGNPIWNQLSVPSGTLNAWDPSSTYIHEPPYFKDMSMSAPGPHGVKNAVCSTLETTLQLTSSSRLVASTSTS
ncbi:hypothetical protein K1719_012891 [Acacia pycnantha]|nr:hypothetical protein K1719_012891 [Acacia pycnantha]